MRAGRDAIFAIVGLFAGTGISSFWRIAPVDVLRCAVPPPDLAPEPGGGEWAEPAPLSAADVAALPAAGTVSAPRQERPRALLRLSAGGRMASRPREGVDPLTPQVPPAQHWDVSHSLSFGELWTEQWTRRYSFGPVRLLNASVWPPMFAVEIRRELLTPTAGAPAAGRVAPFSNEGRVATGGACGDSLRVRFMSREALFAPLRIEERAANCGEYLVVFRPPALEPGLRTRYSLEMRLLHVDGEGLADPPSSLQLYKREFDGPNRPFWSIVSCNASCHESGPRFFNADLHVDGELAVLSPPLEAEALEAMGAALPVNA
ncbi:hypothetical protein T492DRAFT_840753 [Pavlovales sp. CCMP2436]|nr:hypothetical protein T492DRAFT_840753 [Pavlovales sp. CCMP2436]